MGMGKALSDASAAAREVFERADNALGFAISRLCFDGPEEELTLTANTQPAILTTSIAALEALRERVPDLAAPKCAAGHSLGEYSALVAAGALEFEAPDLERSDDVRFLAAFSQFFAVSQDVGTTLEMALTGIIQGINAEAGALFLLDETTGELVCQATVGPLDLRGARVVPSHGILGRCLRRNEIESIHDVRNDPELLGAIDEKNRLT